MGEASTDGWSAPGEEALAAAAVADEALDRGATWSDLADAGLLSLVVPAHLGGEGLGLDALAPVLRAVGGRALELPVWATLCVGALTLARCGSREQGQRWLPGLAEGKIVLAAALAEPGSGIAMRPRVSWDGQRLFGAKVGVGHARQAQALLVTATGPDGSPVALVVDPLADGVTLVDSPTSSGLINGAVEHTVRFDGVLAEPLPGDGAAEHLRNLAIAGLCVEAAGLVAGAREITSHHIAERTQFGRALAQFQAVAQQIADVYVTSRLLDLAADNVVWRVSAGLPVRDALAVAAYWTAEHAPAALHTCHHLHGGTGVDETYPLHRFFSRVRDVVRLFGGPAAALESVRPEAPEVKGLELTRSQRELKVELREYFAGLASEAHDDEMARDRHGETYQRTIRQLGTDGWMGVGWPTEHGGRGLGEVEQTIFANEAQYADVHLPAVTLQTVGPTLMRYGTHQQKERFLARILAGDVHFAIGYSEPEAGTDLASLRTSARREGDHYLVNGQKLWTTGGHQADYVWLAVRTDPDAPKHRGISILIVDTTDPGYSWSPIITADGSHHVNATFFDNVRVPIDMLVGEENDGWRLITTQLNHERVMLGPAGRIEGLRDRVAAWAAAQGVAEEPDVRRGLADATATFRVNELLNWAVARAAETGELSVADASASKVFASEEVQRVGRTLWGIVTRYGDLSDPATGKLARYLDAQAKRNLVLTFGGGVNEVQRELIACFGLGLPKVPR